VLKPLLSILLSLLLAATPVWAADTQTAGEVKALIPDAWRNAHPVKVKDGLVWNDLLQTDARGRLRAGLTDGSLLSLGSNSALKVVQHDAVSQQTSIDMSYGKLRNQVVKITKPDGKYEVKTPNAVIGVIGTDFFVGYENGFTTVICYVGSVSVTAVGTAKVVKTSNQAQSNQAQVTLSAGQMVVIGLKLPPEGFPPESEVIQASMQDTDVNTHVNPHTVIARPKVWIPIVVGLAGGLATGLVLTYGGGSSVPPPAVCSPASRGRSQAACPK
jgi:ferric-dicitrate binding protein FerR (iron transport regulator)